MNVLKEQKCWKMSAPNSPLSTSSSCDFFSSRRKSLLMQTKSDQKSKWKSSTGKSCKISQKSETFPRSKVNLNLMERQAIRKLACEKGWVTRTSRRFLTFYSDHNLTTYIISFGHAFLHRVLDVLQNFERRSRSRSFVKTGFSLSVRNCFKGASNCYAQNLPRNSQDHVQKV